MKDFAGRTEFALAEGEELVGKIESRASPYLLATIFLVGACFLTWIFGEVRHGILLTLVAIPLIFVTLRSSCASSPPTFVVAWTSRRIWWSNQGHVDEVLVEDIRTIQLGRAADTHDTIYFWMKNGERIDLEGEADLSVQFNKIRSYLLTKGIRN